MLKDIVSLATVLMIIFICVYPVIIVTKEVVKVKILKIKVLEK